VRHPGIIAFLAGFASVLGAGWYGFPRVLYEQRTQPVRFSHGTHTGESAGLKCEDCHSVREDGRFTGIPAIAKCAECHAAAVGSSEDEKRMIRDFIEPNREIPWLVYSRQPANVQFPHAVHLKLGKLKCERCHGDHGKTDRLRPFERNRISGYSRDIWGRSISRFSLAANEGMKMSDCERCHREQGVSDSCLACHK
jgi:hypothetical protein